MSYIEGASKPKLIINQENVFKIKFIVQLKSLKVNKKIDVLKCIWIFLIYLSWSKSCLKHGYFSNKNLRRISNKKSSKFVSWLSTLQRNFLLLNAHFYHADQNHFPTILTRCFPAETIYIYNLTNIWNTTNIVQSSYSFPCRKSKFLECQISRLSKKSLRNSYRRAKHWDWIAIF